LYVFEINKCFKKHFFKEKEKNLRLEIINNFPYFLLKAVLHRQTPNENKNIKNRPRVEQEILLQLVAQNRFTRMA
jgi:hypothetical protein